MIYENCAYPVDSLESDFTESEEATHWPTVWLPKFLVNGEWPQGVAVESLATSLSVDSGQGS